MLNSVWIADRCVWVWLACAVALSATVRPATAQNVGSTRLVEQAPLKIAEVSSGVFLVDFGRVAFGNLSLTRADGVEPGVITVRFGEAIKNGRVDTHPPGFVRYSEVKVMPSETETVVVAPPIDLRNTKAPAVLTPAAMGVLTPFRWVEVEGWRGALRKSQIRRRAAFDNTWSDDAATFRSSDPMLDRIWDLCHYTIKATTFAGIFVDGDRERLAYEADAYLNQLGYFAGNADPRIARATFDRLMRFPTWPSEWAPHMVFLSYGDWMETGDKGWLSAHYEGLKTKLLDDRVGPDGLVLSSPELIRHGDIVDWPADERDGYVFTSVNTVVNSFHLRALQEMSELAGVLGKEEESARFSERAKATLAAFQEKLFDPVRGLYRDGVGTQHASLHANLFPLAFGLVPAASRDRLALWLATQGMRGSPYAAQYLLESLFQNGQEGSALALITALGDRSWRHMIDTDATMTWEAWDQKYKPNQDWNHAWGAAPANLLPRFVLGIQPSSPGWRSALIQPHTGELSYAEGQVPTPRGEVTVSWRRENSFTLELKLPVGMTARIELPALKGARRVLVDGAPVKAHREGNRLVVDDEVSGTLKIEER